MSRRTIVFLLCGIALIAFVRFALARDNPTQSPVATATPEAPRPLPVEEPTAEAPEPTSTPKKGAGKSGPEANDANEPSNLTPGLRARLGRIVELYASWPGSTPKKTLIRRLEKQKPFISGDAIDQIKEEWTRTARTVELTVMDVDLEPSFFASSEDPNSADIMAYVTLNKRFKPVIGDPYSKTATQPYKVNLRIVKRKWTVVGITPPSLSASSGG